MEVSAYIWNDKSTEYDYEARRHKRRFWQKSLTNKTIDGEIVDGTNQILNEIENNMEVIEYQWFSLWTIRSTSGPKNS